jgi:glyoxylase-like metal-dependent hydrolase (beta-lactamase superfamily II)
MDMSTVSSPRELYRVTIVAYGRRSTTRSDVFLNYGTYGEPDGPIGMDYFVWVVQNEKRTIVVDTGFSRHGGQVRNRQTLIEPSRVYQILGVDPADAPPVVITHAHYDHTGNIDLFPHSVIHLSRREYEFWTGKHAHREQFHHSVEDDDLAVIMAAHEEGRVALFDDRVELAPGVELIELGGHTPGQSVVRVATSDGVVLLASDAVHYYEEFDRDMPFVQAADLVRMYEGFDTVREYQATGYVDHVVSGHDPDTLTRFEPVEGELAGLAATIGRLNEAGKQEE